MSDLIFNIKLKDQTPVLIRPIEAGDKEELKLAFSNLSNASKNFRFLCSLSNLSDGQVKYLTEVDNKNHIALCAIDKSGEQEIGIGVARYIRLGEEPDSAEFALTVVDGYQNRGLGTILLKLLIDVAKKNGIRKFVAYLLENNTSMLKILRQYQTQTVRENDGSLRMTLDLL